MANRAHLSTEIVGGCAGSLEPGPSDASPADPPAPSFSRVDIPRRKPEDDPAIKARQNTAGRTGFILGCVAAVAAVGINLARTPRPYEILSLVIAALMAALNVPFGIMLALLAEKWTRPRTGKGPRR